MPFPSADNLGASSTRQFLPAELRHQLALRQHVLAGKRKNPETRQRAVPMKA
jgi:hypothetical protein